MFGLFGLFGRSREMQRFDQALRAAGLHPRLVQEAVKLTALKLVSEAGAGADADGLPYAAEVIAYCLLGAGVFAEANGRDRTDAVESRIEAALEAGDSLDARLVLLAMHAGLIEPTVVARYELEAG